MEDELMPYARFDDRYDDHRKIKRALRREPAAVALHAMAITYANRHNTNGEVDREWVEEKLALMPYKQPQRDAIVDVLLETGLFDPVNDDTFLIHDFLDWNLSREQRADLAEQGRRGGLAKAKANGKPPLGPGSGPGSSQGLSEGSSHPGNSGFSTPTPTPTPRLEHPVAAAPPRDQIDIDVDDLCCLMSRHVRAAHGIDPKSREAQVTKGWRDACRAMLKLDGYSREQVAFAIEWVCKHHYWRRRVKSMTRLRSEMGQVAKEIREQRERGGQVVPMAQRRPNASDMLRAIDGGGAA